MGTNRYADRIIGKIILKATLRNLSPLMIGKGQGDAADVEVVQWVEGAKPYIPASSFVGSLKQYLREYTQEDFSDYLGVNDKDNKDFRQSHFIVDDLVPQDPSDQDVVIRDGVRINPQTNTAVDKGKYDYQVVEPGIDFPLNIEITLRNGMDLADAQRFVAAIHAALEKEEFYLGANSNSGLGKMQCRDFKAWHFDFMKHHAEQWFQYLKGTDPDESLLFSYSNALTPLQSASFVISAAFRIKSSLITGAYGIDGQEPDKAQLKSRNQFVISGKSIRGAIRHRALKILNTLGKTDAEQRIEALFGIVEESGAKKVTKSRLRVAECILEPNVVDPIVQDRIRIDRFTGGVVSGGLFSSEPIWTSGQESVELKFVIYKNPSPEEKFLLLLLLKDLWLSDLAIGGEKNIGRGVLIGQKAEIQDQGILIAKFERIEGSGLHFTYGTADAVNDLINPQNVQS